MILCRAVMGAVSYFPAADANSRQKISDSLQDGSAHSGALETRLPSVHHGSAGPIGYREVLIPTPTQVYPAYLVTYEHFKQPELRALFDKRLARSRSGVKDQLPP